MPPPRTDREALIAALAEDAAARAAGSAEPAPEELLDYLAGRLDPAAEQRLGSKLAASPAATRALLDLADLEAAGEPAGSGPADLAARAGWRDFQSRLSTHRSRRPPPWLAAIAASLLVATMGLGIWAMRLQSAMHLPVDLPSLDLVSGSRAGTEPSVQLPAGAPFLRLVLAPSERCADYTAEIAGPAGTSQTLLSRDEMGRLSLLLPGEPGEYRLLLRGCEPRRALEEHRFRITADGG
jgi:hypothetical protein